MTYQSGDTITINGLTYRLYWPGLPQWPPATLAMLRMGHGWLPIATDAERKPT